MGITDHVERSRMIESACAGDGELRAKVEKFFAAEAPADEFFFECTEAIAAAKAESRFLTGLGLEPAPVDKSAGVAAGSNIGCYKLLQKIGEGGCGVVYMAEQEKPVRRRVALKIIKLGMDTKSVIARFEAERQALALMDHPNIARVLDAGATETGRPYFVMELVHGTCITDFCDAKKLPTQQRLKLFIQVCQAIQHAHQKGVIHRDIKPTNSLVMPLDDKLIPKVIDFGIAKAMEEKLTDKTLFTLYGHFVGTPAYMSPEQAQTSGMDIDTRSDIYSLGVLLYELLTGKTPFEQKELMAAGVDEMRKTLRDREPHRPSVRLDKLKGTELTLTAERRHMEPAKLRLALRGDLDWIVMKALEKDRARRYQTANGLAMDIQRYLDNEPVFARPSSRFYRLQKLIRRNKAVFISSVSMAVALMTVSGVSTWLWLKEREMRQRMVLVDRQKADLQKQAAVLEELQKTAEQKRTFAEVTALVKQRRLEKADLRLDEIPNYKAGWEDVTTFRDIGDWDAGQGYWAKALSRFKVVSEINQLAMEDSTEATNQDDALERALDYMRIGAVLVDQGEIADWERFRKTVIIPHTDTKNPRIAERVLRTCLLTRMDGDMIKALGEYNQLTAESIEATAKETGGDAAAWYAYSLGLMAYRSEDYMGATNWCQRSLDFDANVPCREAGVRLIRAMSLARLGESERAHTELAAGQVIVENPTNPLATKTWRWPGFWFDWAFDRVLLREAKVTIEGAPEAAD